MSDELYSDADSQIPGWKILLKNGCPMNFIQTQIRRFLDGKQQISNLKPPDKSFRRITFKLPYIDNASIHFEKELHSF